MPAAAIALSMLVILVFTASAGASQSCMSRTESCEHFGSVRIDWHFQDQCGDTTFGQHQIDEVPRWAGIEPPRHPIAACGIDTSQVEAPPVIASEPGPAVTPRAVVLVAITIVLMLGTIEALFRSTIK
jgi:hypothetical protein